MQHISFTSSRRGGRSVRRLTSAAALVFISACGSSASESATSGSDAVGTTTTESAVSDTVATSTTAPVVDSGDLSGGFALASWGDNVTVTIENGNLHYVSDGVPNHERQAEYALPTGQGGVPTAETAAAGADPTVAQHYDYTIPLTPVKAATPTSTSLGAIGVMISGAALFNPYEGDGTTVAAQNNFFVLNAAGDEIWFLDDCAGHPTPMGSYHYHALPKCVTTAVDQANGPSHIIGIAFDGYPIYGDKDIDGNQITAVDLDGCNGITSATPEFPNGVYHYVLLDVTDSTSSIRCLAGEVNASLA